MEFRENIGLFVSKPWDSRRSRSVNNGDIYSGVMRRMGYLTWKTHLNNGDIITLLYRGDILIRGI
jgi:hypothetical protein